MHLTKQKCVSLPTSGVGKGISSGNFLQFYLDCYIGSPGNPHSKYVSGSRNLCDIGPYAPDQTEVYILTWLFGVRKGISSGNFLQLLLYWLSWEPTLSWQRILCTQPSRSVCFLTDFRCGKGGLFRHPGETVRILQSVVVAGAHHVAVVIAGSALTPAKHTVLLIINSVLRIRIRALLPFWTPGLGSGSRIPTPYFLELSDKLLNKKFYNSLKTGPKFISSAFKKYNNFQFCEICG